MEEAPFQLSNLLKEFVAANTTDATVTNELISTDSISDE